MVLQLYSSFCLPDHHSCFVILLCFMYNIAQKSSYVMYDYLFIGYYIRLLIHTNYLLRVWTDWIIDNNKFMAMNMIEGSRCGEGTHRSTKVSCKEGKRFHSKCVTVNECFLGGVGGKAVSTITRPTSCIVATSPLITFGGTQTINLGSIHPKLLDYEILSN